MGIRPELPAVASVYSTQGMPQMASDLSIPRFTWDAAVPSGISEAAHMKSLALMMARMFWSTGMSWVFKAHPVIISMLTISAPELFGEIRFDVSIDWPLQVGYVGGVQLWADPHVGGGEILVVDEEDSLQHRGILKLINFDVAVFGPLDRLAQIK